MKKTKRITAALLACIMAASVVGCGKKDKNESVEVPMLAEGETYTPQKDMEITVWQTQGSDYVPPKSSPDDVVEQWLIDKTKVKVKNAYGNGGGQWEAVLSRLIAGDNFPELVACGGGQGPAHFNRLDQAEKIWELTPELLQTYAPDIWEKVPEKMWERMKVNGKILGIPYQFGANKEIDPNITELEQEVWGGVATRASTDLWIRDDIAKMLFPECKDYDECVALLEETGKPIGDELFDIPIHSTEDLVKLLRDIKDLNLKENNKPVYAFGFSGADCWVPLARLGPALKGYVTHNYTSSWNPVKQEITLPILDEPVKDALRIENQLIRDEVIEPESLMHTDEQCKEKILNGQYGVAVLSAIMHPPTINKLLEDNGKSFRYRPLYIDMESPEGYQAIKSNTTWGASVGILKTVSAEDLPQILNWLNTQFTDEYEEIRYWGPKEAGLYTDNPDGTRTFKDEALNEYFINHKSLPEGTKTYGLNGSVGMFSIKFRQDTKWDPMVYNNKATYQFTPAAGAKILPYGKYASDPKHLAVEAPPHEAWDAEFAGLDSVTKYWSSRSQWEDPFKLVLAAKSDEEFEQKYQAAVDNLYSIVDVDQMLKEMTEIARQHIAK